MSEILLIFSVGVVAGMVSRNFAGARVSRLYGFHAFNSAKGLPWRSRLRGAFFTVSSMAAAARSAPAAAA